MRRQTIIIFFTCLVTVLTCSSRRPHIEQNPLFGKTICVDPGHGGTAATDTYRTGPGGEREEWINLRVALRLQDMLESNGAHVTLTRTEDVAVSLKARAQRAVESKADIFLSIHHNATADRKVNFPIIYYHGNASENRASVRLAQLVARHLKAMIFNDEHPVSVVSDHVIFPEAGTSVLRNSYGIPGIIGEASFFSNPSEEQKLKDPEHNALEAEAYVRALESYFSAPSPPVEKTYTRTRVPAFRVLEEADRMSSIALMWKEDYHAGRRLFSEEHPDSLNKALLLFTRSARSFPDSYLARECHQFRARLLERLGKHEEAEEEYRRVEEYFVDTRLIDAK